jgi:hypothetical protein
VTYTVIHNQKEITVKPLIRLLLAALAALALVLAFTVPASASADGPKLCNPTGGACVWFTNNGDVIHVQDVLCDNHAAVAQVQVTDGVTIHDNLWNGEGCGTILTYSYGTAIPEGVNVYYRPCLGVDYTTLSSCNSGWTHGGS